MDIERYNTTVSVADFESANLRPTRSTAAGEWHNITLTVNCAVKHSPIEENMRFEKGHTPANKGGGKKINADAFMDSFMMYLNGQINQDTFAKNVGLSTPTLHKHLKELIENGFIDGKFFTDGKPMIIGLNGFLRGDEEQQPKEQPIKPSKETVKQEVVYPKLI